MNPLRSALAPSVPVPSVLVPSVVAPPVLALAVLAAAATAQADVEPPIAELYRLKQMIGQWEGHGTATFGPDEPPVAWTSKSQTRWVLGNYFVMSDTDMEFEGMGVMRFRQYIGWNKAQQRYLQVTINNVGDGSLATPKFTDYGRYTLMFSRTVDDYPMCERVVTEYKGDECTFSVELLDPMNPISKVIEGRMQRVDGAAPAAIGEVGSMRPIESLPCHQPMQKVGRMVGSYDFEGEMTTAAGAAPVKITGRDEVTALFDGAVVLIRSRGKAAGATEEYVAHRYLVWNKTDRHYERFVVSNTGEIGHMKANYVGDDAFVLVSSGIDDAVPVAAREVLRLDEQGRLASLVAYVGTGADEPRVDCRGSYEPAQ